MFIVACVRVCNFTFKSLSLFFQREILSILTIVHFLFISDFLHGGRRRKENILSKIKRKSERRGFFFVLWSVVKRKNSSNFPNVFPPQLGRRRRREENVARSKISRNRWKEREGDTSVDQSHIRGRPTDLIWMTKALSLHFSKIE